MKNFVSITVLISLLLGSNVIFGQSRSSLENERLKIIENIERTNNLIKQNQSDKAATLADLAVVEQQIKNRETLLTNIKNQFEQIDSVLQIRQSNFDSLNNALKLERESFDKLMRSVYIRKVSENRLSAILSAESINEAFRIWLYLKQFESFQKQRSEKLYQSMTELNQSIDLLNNERTHKEALFSAQKENLKILEEDKLAKNQMIEQIRANDRILKRELDKRKLQREQLNLAIENLIINQLKFGKDEEEQSFENLPVNTVASDKAFESSKGLLSWPVEQGIISSRFGRRAHKTLKNIKVENNGIDILTKPNAQVKAVFEGKVVGLSEIPGYDNMIIVQHGLYYTVYSKLKTVNVKLQDNVSQGSILGLLSVDSNGNSELHFEIWKAKTKQNPENWLIKI